ncbi:unnamed protein product [Orchesella dallaii]|uniref:Endophilin-B1 n=1 Tax=Orchesella dallaii TaxID=48710 RepID=A0ABP1Q5I4_9HEXA
MNMDFNVKKLVGEAGNFISRAVQMTEEVIYAGEKTNIDPQLERLCKQGDEAKNWTQRICKDTEAVLVPNPGYRAEDFLMEKIDKKRPTRMSNLECLGQGMIDSGNEFGSSAAYGSMLVKVGTAELKVGQTEKEFITSAVTSFVNPLARFLENEVKNATRERKILENRRLDLDSAKNKLRKARSMSSGPPTKDGQDPRVMIQQAEREVIAAQSEFNSQTEICKVQMEILMAARDRHIENLKSFVQAQTTYFARCHQLMLDLNRELDIMPLHSVNLSQSFSIDDSQEDMAGTESNNLQLRAKVMYDYVGKAPQEISVLANEVVAVHECPEDTEFFIAQKGSLRGRIPKACVLLL